MFKSFFAKMIKNNKGFTLIELVVVVAILGILVSIAVPRIGDSSKTAAKTAHNANVRTLESAATMYIAEKGVPSTLLTWTDSETTENDETWGKYLQDWPTISSGLYGTYTIKGTEVIINNTTKYKVEIDTDGEITVTPDTIIDKDE